MKYSYDAEKKTLNLYLWKGDEEINIPEIFSSKVPVLEVEKLIVNYGNISRLPRSIRKFENVKSLKIEPAEGYSNELYIKLYNDILNNDKDILKFREENKDLLEKELQDGNNMRMNGILVKKINDLIDEKLPQYFKVNLESIGDLENLEELVIDDYCPLPESIGKLKNLKEMYLNNITSLPESIGNLKNLKELIISGKTSLPESIKQLNLTLYLPKCYKEMNLDLGPNVNIVYE